MRKRLHVSRRFVSLAVALWAVMASCSYSVDAMDEMERREEHIKRYGTQWTPERYNPDTPGWKALMEARFRQAAEVEERAERYEAYMQTVTPAIVSPNFTEYGFGLVRGPQELSDTLRQAIRAGFENGDAREEHMIQVIEGPRCLFIDRPDLTKRVLDELQSYTEAWARMELTPVIAYGFRLYRNESRLNMHVDKPQTHVISMIYHIDSSDDSEPWPVYIEGFDGKTHEVILFPGDILFYESSKCLHGRPKTFNGTWYSSIFVHYFPTHGWQEINHRDEAHYAVPIYWSDDIPPDERKMEPIKMMGTGMKEPGCPNQWCRTLDTVKWSGPAEEGVWIDAVGTRHLFKPTRYQRDEL